MRPQTSAVLLALAGGAYFVDLFLRWAPRHVGGGISPGRLGGWEASLGNAGLLSLALVLVELVRLARLWRAAGASLVGLLLAVATGVLGLSAFLHLHWFGFFSIPFDEFAYGAWIGLVLSVMLLGLAGLRFVELRGVLLGRGGHARRAA